MRRSGVRPRDTNKTMSDWCVERLDRSHQRKEFSCGQGDLDKFLKELARQYDERYAAITYVAVRSGDKRVCGYYTLSAGAVARQDVPPATARKLPHHPVPVAHLGRLAIDQAIQGQGLGRFLLMDAFRRCLTAAQDLAIFALEVRAIDDRAGAFYLKYGFIPLLDNPLHLYLPLQTIRQALRSQG
jgi:ribosomal protein S18 acetylase RimI-like enzyme